MQDLYEEDPPEGLHEEGLSRAQRKKARRAQKSAISANNFEMQSVYPKTKNQQIAFEAYEEGLNLLLHGVAGTGKTFIAMYLALRSVIDENTKIESVTIVRSAVPSRDIGFLPGNEKDKMAVYEAPYVGIASELFGRDDAYTLLKNKKVIRFLPTSFVRGTTITNSVVIIEEVQNMSDAEINSVITRLGKNTKLILCGDHRQDDLSGRKGEVSGIKGVFAVLKKMNSIAKVEFNISDVQRSAFVKEYLQRRMELGLDVPMDV